VASEAILKTIMTIVKDGEDVGRHAKTWMVKETWQ